MSYLIDTNVFARAAQPSHPDYQAARNAVDSLRLRGETMVIVPQVLYEFWVVATRPVNQNGLGFSVAVAQIELTKIKALFPILDDTPAIFLEWEQLVVSYGVVGKRAHDARLAAAMQVHRLSHLLTFNSSDFQRYQGITAVSPSTLVQSTP